MNPVYYRDGYKYQIDQDWTTELSPELFYAGVWENDYLKVCGRELTIKRHYASDGPSGPTIDTKNFMRGAFRHDAGYQLIRLGVYPESSRIYWDRQLRSDCKADGMWTIRAQWVYLAVRLGGEEHAKHGMEKPALCAP